MMTKEIWKSIKGREGYYEISTYGRLKRLAHIIEYESGYKLRLSYRVYEAKGDGTYTQIRLSSPDNRLNTSIHREVAKAFIPNPNKYPHVGHKDGDKNNNCLCNLEWTNEKNSMKKIMSQGHIPSIEQSKPIYVWRVEIKRGYRNKIINTTRVKYIGQFHSISQACKELNITQSNLIRTIQGSLPHTKNFVAEYTK